MRSSRLKRPSSTAALIAAAALVGCGGGDDRKRTERPATPTPSASPTPEPKRVPVRRVDAYGVPQLRTWMQQQTGWETQTFQTGGAQVVSQRSDPLPERIQQRWGIWEIKVFTGAGDLASELRSAGLQRGGGLRFKRIGDRWMGTYVHRNLLMSFFEDQPAASAPIQRSIDVLRRIGEGTRAYFAKAPITEQPCEGLDMTPEGSASGTCRDGARSVRIVDAGRTITYTSGFDDEAPEYEARVLNARLERDERTQVPAIKLTLEVDAAGDDDVGTPVGYTAVLLDGESLPVRPDNGQTFSVGEPTYEAKDGIVRIPLQVPTTTPKAEAALQRGVFAGAVGDDVRDGITLRTSRLRGLPQR